MATNNQIVFQRQNNIRVSNQIFLIESLKDGPKAITSLANEMAISYTAVVKIITELIENGLVKVVPDPAEKVKRKNVKGRKPVLVELNKNEGVVCAIDLSRRDISLCLADVSNHIIVRGVIENVVIITQKVLERIVVQIKKLLADPLVQGLPLLSICISSPGKIDKETNNYIYAPKIENAEKVNLPNFFSAYFPVDVYVYNDVNLGCVGEKYFGCIPKDAKDVFFVFCDMTSGSGLILNGQLYEGFNGFAGEFSHFHAIDDYSKASHSGQVFTVGNIFADIQEQVQRNPDHPLFGKKHYDIEEIKNLFFQDDPLVVNSVAKSAKYNALELLSVTNLLDLEYIVIEGKITEFGERYKEMLIKYFNAYDANHNHPKILFSSLNSDANLLGAVFQGTNMFLLKRFGDMTKKRTSTPDYNVQYYFGNNV